MHDELDITNINVGLPSTVVQRFKLPQQTIDYLWERIDIAKKNPRERSINQCVAGNISHMYKLEDPQNLVIQNVNNILFNPIDNPKMFKFINTEVANVYRKSGYPYPFIGKFNPQLDNMWVNIQKKCEFQALHRHIGLFSFVIWMDIPYDCKDETHTSMKGNFSFASSCPNSRQTTSTDIPMSPKMNGYFCFFPSDLSHQVYPFYTSDKDRITISGNISHPV
jgi:hypothetical protein